MNFEFFNNTASFNVSSGKKYLLLFLLWPFLAFLTAIANFNRKEARVVVYGFLIYYGLNFVIGETGFYVDAAGYAEELKANAALPFSDFFRIVGGLYSVEDSVDIYEPFVSFVVSRFTSDYRLLFGIFAAVFGYFYIKSLKFIHDIYRQNPGWDSLIHLIFFSLILPVTLINGVRMWTAAWIFFYGAINVIWFRNPKFLLITLASSLVHFSFISANIVLLIYYFAGNRNFIYLPLTILSFFFPYLIAPFIGAISLRLGGSIQSRIAGYSSEEYILGVREHLQQNVWFIQLGNDLVFYYLIGVIIVIQVFYRKYMLEENERNLFSFILLFLSFVNFGSTIPSFGSRFQLVLFLFATFYIILFFRKVESSRINILTLAGLFPMLLYIAITLRVGSVSINPWIFGPCFGTSFFAPQISLGELLFF